MEAELPNSTPPSNPRSRSSNHCLARSSSSRFTGIIKLRHGSSNFNDKCIPAVNKKQPMAMESATVPAQNCPNPFEVVASTIMKALKALKKPAIAVVLLGLLLTYDPNKALAASGGRVGGTSFSWRSSRSSSSRSSGWSSSRYSVPRTSGRGFPLLSVVRLPSSPRSSEPEFQMVFRDRVSVALIVIVFTFVMHPELYEDILRGTQKTSILKVQEWRK